MQGREEEGLTGRFPVTDLAGVEMYSRLIYDWSPQTRKSCLRKLMGELFVVLEKSLD